MQETWVPSLGWEDFLEKGMATHSSMLAWRIPWTKEPGGLQPMGLQRVGQLHFTSIDLYINIFIFKYIYLYLNIYIYRGMLMNVDRTSRLRELLVIPRFIRR